MQSSNLVRIFALIERISNAFAVVFYHDSPYGNLMFSFFNRDTAGQERFRVITTTVSIRFRWI